MTTLKTHTELIFWIMMILILYSTHGIIFSIIFFYKKCTIKDISMPLDSWDVNLDTTPFSIVITYLMFLIPIYENENGSIIFMLFVILGIIWLISVFFTNIILEKIVLSHKEYLIFRIFISIFTGIFGVLLLLVY